MASWSWIKYAPWGEIAKAASRVPDLVRDIRKPREGGDESPRSPGAPESLPDVAQLKFEMELMKANLERLRAHSENQAKAMEDQARVLSESFDAISARLRFATWLAAFAAIAGVVALVAAFVR